MLNLTTKDLGVQKTPGVEAGVKTWFVTVPWRKSPVLAVAWTDLALIDPKVSWPTLTYPEREEGWGETTFRLVYLPELARVVVRPGVPVPVLGPCLELKVRSTLPLRCARRTVRQEGVTVCGLTRPDGSMVYWTRETLIRVEAATGKNIRHRGTSVRLAKLGGVNQVILVYLNSHLRAVATPV